MTENPSLTKNPDLDSWIAITADGVIRVRVGKVDIGQKIFHRGRAPRRRGIGCRALPDHDDPPKHH